MSGLCGWIGAGASADRRALAGMAEALTRHDGLRAATWQEGAAALAAASRGGPPVHAEGALAAAVAGPLRWDDADLLERSRTAGGAAALLEGYRRHGAAVLDRTRGHFALAVRDGGRVLLATDRLGVWPVFWQESGGTLLFASNAASLDAHPLGRVEVDPQGIYDYVYFSAVPGPGTVRVGRSRLLPGECLEYADGRVRRRTYWAPAYEEDNRRPVPELVAELRGLLRGSVERDAEGAEVGCFLSGGLDSSTVAAVLAEGRAVARTYSIGFDAASYDEMRYARITAERFGTVHKEYYVTPDDVADAIPRVAQMYAEPFGNESAVPTYCCARLAREDGVERILAGDGGDELFAGNTRYVTQHVFGLWGKIPGPLRRYLMEPVLAHFPWGERIWPVRKARSYVRQANVPMPQRLQTYNMVERFGAEHIFDPGFLASVDRHDPRALMEEVYGGTEARTLLNRMLHYDMKFTLADNDLPKVNRMCELAGIEVAYPLLSTELVDFAAALHPALKLRRFKLRWFYKRAMEGFLAPETLTKKKHGFGLPFGIWLRDHVRLQRLAADSLDGVRRRGIFRDAFLEEVRRGHRDEHPIYYGVLIWHLMMLEQWYRAHVDDAAAVCTGS